MSSELMRFWATLGVPAQAVILLLGMMSLASIAIVVERTAGLWIARRDTDRFVPLAQAALQSGILTEVVPLAERCSMCPESEMVRESGIDFEAGGLAEWEINRRLLLARWSVDRQLARLNLDLRRGLPIIGTISATAPFVGLLGTVLGIIRAFDSLGKIGGGLAGVSLGIAEALITTALGLFVAIPATWAYNFISDKVDLAVFRARRFSTFFLEALASPGGVSTRRILAQGVGHVPGGARISTTPIRSEINVTPLVDVVLVLLIIFMVITPPPRTALDLGISKVVRSEAGAGKEKKDRVFVRVTADNQVYLNDREVLPGSLESALKSAFQGKAGEPLFFEADPGADYPQVVRILDQASAAGVDKIAIVSRGAAAARPGGR
ncbi:MAG TPA: MotA/TolQ/ExbB proton channel family protein [Candidatus Polarisedimenticolia bacterium]|nr:MotA/TolQ/ExbB proton channel family protein [Candidatus Polarisedimenticolia bacterium]